MTVALGSFVEDAYKIYGTYVIENRALPEVTDGLKPVQRRIIWAMHSMGIKPNSSYKKAARITGEVIGKFHPHGDKSVFDAMANMVQSGDMKLTNLPLIEGYGNWGSMIDPPAASRYVEARLHQNSKYLLDYVDVTRLVSNYSGEYEEPITLPATIPYVLVNGCSGIAVGVSTAIPSHNLEKVLRACKYLLQNPKCSIDDLIKIVGGPEFPFGGKCTDNKELRELYRKGKGSLTLWCDYYIKDHKIIVNGFPTGFNITKFIENAWSLEGVSDVINDVKKGRHSVTVNVKKTYDVNEVCEWLEAYMYVIVHYQFNLTKRHDADNIQFVQYNLKSLLVDWLKYRIDLEKKKLTYDIGEIDNKLYRLDALIIASQHLDALRESWEAKDQLQHLIQYFKKKKVKITEEQIGIILNATIKRLAKLSVADLKTNQKNLLNTKSELQKELKQITKTVSKRFDMYLGK